MKRSNAIAALGAMAALVAGGVAVSGCGASATLDPIARAAEVSSQQTGVTIAMSMQFSSPALPGGSYAITANGSFDERAHTGQMTMDLSGVPGLSSLPGGGDGQVRIVMVYPDIYMNMPFLAGKLPEGKTWMKLDIGKAAAAAGVDSSSLSSLDQSDPTQFLEYLRGSSGGVVSFGSETIEGVPTTHYHGTLELSRVLSKLPGSEQAAAKAALEKLGTGDAFPVEVWIDAQGRVRRMEMSLGGAGATAGLSATITIDFKSYGAVPPVVPPPAGEVFDATSTAISGIGAGAG
ncbi:MAG: hypothetical protein ACHQDY_02830 [Solirubrobacterales bacterium]